MGIISIFKKELIQNVRDKKSMFMMVIFPIVMILILGTAFKGNFSNTGNIPKMKVVYTLNKNVKITKTFESFMKDMEKSMNLEFKKIDNKNKAVELIKNGKYDSYIEIKDDKYINISTNNLREFNASLIHTLIDTFVQRSNVMEQIVEVNPRGIRNIKENKEPSYVKVRSLNAKRAPRAIDYYTITMFTMIILYSIATGAMSILSEKRRRTLERIRCSGISLGKIFIGKILGCISITIIQVSIIFLFTKYILKSDWGSNVGAILLISFSLIVMAVSIGVGMAVLIKNENIMSVALNMIIPIFVFLGGGYIPLNLLGSNVLNNMSKISPIKWTNDAIFRIIYGGDLSVTSTAILVNCIIALVFLMIPLIFSRREVA
ncbi:ABC transporter permease [Clostridiaceae bacterium 14S0207]|nr:ABC transporter permease [Clostridiaceae bacterium 14S0207]